MSLLMFHIIKYRFKDTYFLKHSCLPLFWFLISFLIFYKIKSLCYEGKNMNFSTALIPQILFHHHNCKSCLVEKWKASKNYLNSWHNWWLKASKYYNNVRSVFESPSNFPFFIVCISAITIIIVIWKSFCLKR
jgi:hypothetical protein